MLIKNLLFESLPHAEFSDSVYRALSLMQDNHVEHISVEHEGRLAGIISESVLLEVDEEETIGDLQHLFLNFPVKEDDHFLSAVSVAAIQNLTVVPVVDAENNLKGSLGVKALLKHLAEFMVLNEQHPGALIVMEIDDQHYSFSEIGKIIEANDAQVTQLNTSRNPEKGTVQITIRISKPEVSDIVASFQRYDYNVKYYSGEELYENELKSNYENLMNYLNI